MAYEIMHDELNEPIEICCKIMAKIIRWFGAAKTISFALCEKKRKKDCEQLNTPWNEMKWNEVKSVWLSNDRTFALLSSA